MTLPDGTIASPLFVALSVVERDRGMFTAPKRSAVNMALVTDIQDGNHIRGSMDSPTVIHLLGGGTILVTETLEEIHTALATKTGGTE